MKMQLSGYEVFILTLREIEDSYPIHPDLIEWARWGMGRNFESPFLARPAIWTLPGDPDPDRDPEAIPERVNPPVNEKRAEELDKVINDREFPALWRKILCVHYLHPRSRAGWFHDNPLPDWQKPAAANLGQQAYLDHFRAVLDRLELV